MAGSNDRSPLVPIVLLCLVIGAGVAAYVKLAPADTVPREVQNEQQTGGGRVYVITPYYANDDLAFRHEPADVPKDVDPRVFAINEYIKKVEFLPKGSELKSCTVDNGTATLDFTAPFYTSYGTADESTVINGILAVMGQFKEVSYVKIIVEGKPIDTLGNLELTDPLQVTRLPGTETPLVADKPAKS